jgi:DNA-binding HxlR family transcriptional regulator
MAQYGDYCPLARATEIFATRWTPLIVRNLQMGCTTFSAIHAGVPGVSRTLLSQRLRMLEHHGIVERPAGTREYALTEAGRELGVVCDALGRWGELWIELAPEQFDASKVLWALSVKIAEESLPTDRCVLRFDVAAPEREHFWLVLDRPTVEVCRRPVGDHDDLVVRVAHAEALVRWHTGDISLGQAMHAGQIEVDGPRWLERLFASWGGTVTYPGVAGIAGPGRRQAPAPAR